MKRFTIDFVFAAVLLLVAVAGPAYSQAEGRSTFTGTAVIYGSGMNTRTVTRSFTLHVERLTTQSEANQLLSVLDDQGQDGLLRAMSNNDLGRFSLGGRLGDSLRAVIVDDHNGKKRLRAIFQRWIGFGELRGGYRSVDYPFSYVEIVIDPRTGRGDGTFFPAARIRFKEANQNRPETIEIEDFGVFPGRLMGVTLRGKQLQ
ncbi:hypothetical protein BH20ACI2_BH20ACI2_10890 [soil metagenome]